MRRIIPLTVLALTLFGGTAMADRERWRNNDRSGVIVRDHRDRVHRDDRVRTRRVFHRRPVFVNNGRFVFNGGITRTYTRPVIRVRYQDYRYRPQPIDEQCDPVQGYTWVQGTWNWNGHEWLWTAGYYAPDSQYNDNSYQSSYDDDSYDGSYQDPYYQQQTYQQPVYQQPTYQQPVYQQPTYQQPYVRGGVTIQGGIRF